METVSEPAIDLRSDTVTLPTQEMLDAMASTPLGDDCYGEDPTVNRLEEMAAEKVGKEAAMLVPSGTMANLCAILVHARPGEEVIFEAEAHTYLYEAGAYAYVGGCSSRLVKGNLGALDPGDVERAIRDVDVHQPPTGLICVENTNNRAGGTIVWPEQLAALADVARRHHVAVHMDGARLFNAAVASGRPAPEFSQHVDSVMFCLSKGLSAPVGSILAGKSDFIERARWKRKMLGGAMRQSGVVAAAGIVALRTMIDRLAEDHANARSLGEGIRAISRESVDMNRVQTNMVYVNTAALGLSAREFVEQLQRRGVRCLPTGEHSVRLVTHRGVSERDVRRALDVVGQVSEA